MSGGNLRLIDYQVISALSEIYRTQEILEGAMRRLADGALSSAATFDLANRESSSRMLWLSLADIQSSEQILLELYDKHLPAIAAAADRH